jgi:inner membrane protein
MFNSTHTFVGIVLARTGLDRWVPRAAITAAIAANLPDVDIVTGFKGTATYLQCHRGITHSIVGIPALALGLTAVMYFFSGNFWKTYLVALLAMATHPLLDLANTYGLRPFLPWQSRWYYGDVLPIIDPYLDAILLIGILAGETFKDNKRLMTCMSIGLLLIYVGGRIELRNLAAAELETLAARTAGTEKWSVAPEFLNPLVWNGIIQTPKEMLKVNIEPLDKIMTEVSRIDRGRPAQVPQQALRSESASVLLAFARFPIMRGQQTDSGFRLLIFDYRFYNETTNRALGSEIILDRSYRITKESLSFQKSLDP